MAISRRNLIAAASAGAAAMAFSRHLAQAVEHDAAMRTGRIHRASSADGTTVAGRVEGQGPPLVFVHGILSDGETLAPLVSHLAKSFTCYLMSTRGRGMSEESSDLSGNRRIEDVIAFAESIGEPVAVFGHSLGGRIAFEAAAISNQVSAVAAFEPAVRDVLKEEGAPDLAAAIRQMAETADEGRLAEAAETFFEHFIAEDELAMMRRSGVMDRAGELVPIELEGFRQDREAQPMPLSATLQELVMPILLMKGTESTAWFHHGVRFITEHAPEAEVRTLEGEGHFAPVFAPEAVAAEIRRSFG